MSGAISAIGPPSSPEQMRPMASTCGSLALSSMMRPTVQLPSPMGPATIAAVTKVTPPRSTSPWCPSAMSSTIATLQVPSVGIAVMLV